MQTLQKQIHLCVTGIISMYMLHFYCFTCPYNSFFMHVYSCVSILYTVVPDFFNIYVENFSSMSQLGVKLTVVSVCVCVCVTSE